MKNTFYLFLINPSYSLSKSSERTNLGNIRLYPWTDYETMGPWPLEKEDTLSRGEGGGRFGEQAGDLVQV